MHFKVYEKKLRKMFVKFSDPKYVITDNYSIEKLLTHLSTLRNRDLAFVCEEWIRQMVSNKVSFVDSISDPMKTFILRLCATMTDYELFHAKGMHLQLYDKVFEHFKDSEVGHCNPSVKLAYINVLQAMTAHSRSLSWFIESEIWKYVLKIYLKNITVFINKASTDFIIKLIWKLNDLDEEQSCITILESIIQPICEHPWKDSDVINSDQQREMHPFLTPTLSLLVSLIGAPKYFGKGNIIARYLYGRSSFEWSLWNIYFICHNENVLLNFSKLVFVTEFARVNMYKREEEEMTDDDIVKCNLVYFNLIRAMINKRGVDIALDLSIFCHRYLNEVCKHLSNDSGNYKKLESLRKQFIILPLVSILISIKRPKNNDQEILQLFVQKVFAVSSEQGTRIAYSFRDLIKDCGNCETVAIKSVQRLMSIKDTITEFQANMIFQALFYRLKDLIPLGDDGYTVSMTSGDSFESGHGMKLLCNILDGLYWMIEKYDISWHESVEVTCVYQITTNLITVRNLSTNCVVQALRLIRLTILKFLSPNLALLIDSPNESNMNQIGQNIYAKLHDKNWEVRDSALEVLLTCTKIALVKYPPLQSQILDNSLGPLVVTVALNDMESYTRATALRCLGAMVNIQSLWDQCLSAHPDLYVELMKILHNDTEGLIRKEVVGVLSSIYVHQSFPDHLQDYLFRSMYYACVEDLYWEVQLAALQFWKMFVNHLLINQGMVDGKFPSVTFSKERRKIVTLNDGEITKRLKKVVEELSTKGCLGVLLYCLTNDVDIDVLEFAYGIVKEIKLLLDEHKVEFNSEANNMDSSDCTSAIDEVEIKPVVKYEMDILDSSFLDKEKSNMVIESILNANDMNLLANVYQNEQIKQEIETSDKEDIVVLRNIHITLVTPVEFVKMITNTNYGKLIEAKKAWLSGTTNLNSLLDDMLGEYNPTEANDMDCY